MSKRNKVQNIRSSIINNIEAVIPEKTIQFEYFLKILGMCNNATILNSSLIQTTSDQKLKPTITFVTKAIKDPAFFFTGSGLKEECFYVGELPIAFNTDSLATNSDRAKKPLVAIKSDNVGEYLRVKFPFATYNQLNFKQLYHRIADKVAFLDHVGVQINSCLLPKDRYEKMKKIIAGSSYLHEYSTEEKWLFIVPASSIEQQQGVEIDVKRDPKFEFVYNFKYFYPEIQLDIQTGLSPKETLALFPPPYGHHDPNPITGDYCSSVFIYTGWENVSLRVDLRFYIPNFSSTDWLLNKGSRIFVPLS